MMKNNAIKKWTMASILGMSHWFFGNLYESVVIAPNWVVNSSEQVLRLHDFFINTSPTTYFIPVILLATLSVWALALVKKPAPFKSNFYKAGIFAVLSMLINVFIVSTIVVKLFSTQPDLSRFATLTWRWNLFNFFRMASVGMTVYYLFRGYIQLERASVSVGK